MFSASSITAFTLLQIAMCAGLTFTSKAAFPFFKIPFSVATKSSKPTSSKAVADLKEILQEHIKTETKNVSVIVDYVDNITSALKSSNVALLSKLDKYGQELQNDESRVDFNLAQLHSRVVALESKHEALEAKDEVNCYGIGRIYGSSCYWFSDVKLSFQAAQATCAIFNGHLVIINDKSENDFVGDNVPNPANDWWIGVHSLLVNNVFVNVGLPKTGNMYTKWGNHQPDGAGNNERCVHMMIHFDDHGWNDNSCHRNMFFVCEWTT